MERIHIGNKIREVLTEKRYSVAWLAKKIHLTNDAAYKMLRKEEISTPQLRKISEVVGHDFLDYYRKEKTVNEPSKQISDHALTREDVMAMSEKLDLLIIEMRHVTKSNEQLLKVLEQALKKRPRKVKSSRKKKTG